MSNKVAIMKKQSELHKVQAGKLDQEIKITEMYVEIERLEASLSIQKEKESAIMEEINKLKQEK